MATLAQFEKRLERIADKASIELILFVVMKENEKAFIRANKAQLNKGENTEGHVIGFYAYSTENRKRDYVPKKPKIEGEPYNFEDKGGLFDGFFLDTDGERAQLFSVDYKAEYLEDEYDGIFGLTPDSTKKIYKELILPQFLKEIRTELQLA